MKKSYKESIKKSQPKGENLMEKPFKLWMLLPILIVIGMILFFVILYSLPSFIYFM